MYKVFINEKVICFTNNVESTKEFSDVLVLKFYQKELTPLLIELLDENSKTKHVIIYIDNFEEAFDVFKTNFKLIQAAGGVVKNKEDKLLFIYRMDKWDLPKGKLEKDEDVKTAAIREVEEECGINELIITNKLSDTYHIYEHKGTMVLKQTSWFEMKSEYTGNLVPQIEEGITNVEWLSVDEVNSKVMNNTYQSIKEFLSTII